MKTLKIEITPALIFIKCCVLSVLACYISCDLTSVLTREKILCERTIFLSLLFDASERAFICHSQCTEIYL